MPPQRQISKNNNHLFRYLIFQRSEKSSLTNSTLINPSKAAFKEPAPRTIPSTQQNYTQTTSPTLRPIPHSARYPPRIDQKVARMARARHPKRARSSESVPRGAAAFFDGLSVEKSRIQHDSSKRSWHRRPVERDVGISAVLSSKPRLSLERARRRRARIPALPTGPSCCATLSSGQIVSTKTRDPAAGHRTRTANYRLARTRACKSANSFPSRADSDELRETGRVCSFPEWNSYFVIELEDI